MKKCIKCGLAISDTATKCPYCSPELFAYLKKIIDAYMQKSQPVTEHKSNTYVLTGTQAFRNFTERTDNNYSEKIMKQYRQLAHKDK